MISHEIIRNTSRTAFSKYNLCVKYSIKKILDIALKSINVIKFITLLSKSNQCLLNIIM